MKPHPCKSAPAASPNPPSPNKAYPLKPEWVRIPDAIRVSGLSRSTLYELISANRIKSFSNREKGTQRGVRLIHYDSLIGFLDQAYQASIDNDAAAVPAAKPVRNKPIMQE